MSEELTGGAEAPAPTDIAVSTPAAETAVSTNEPSEAAAPDIDGELMNIWNKANPLRGADGKFQSTNTEQPSEDGGSVQEASTDQAQEQAPVEPATPAIDPPVSWSGEMKAKWATFPPEAQAYIAQREKEAAQGFSRLGQQVKALEPLAQTIEQNRSVFERNGVKPEQGVALLLQAQAMLDQDPVSGIAEIARRYGIDLGALQGAQTRPVEIVQLQAKISQLEQALNETSTRVLSREEREVNARREAAETLVSDFRKANPDFDLVESDVIDLIPSIRGRNPEYSEKEVLAAAFKKAVRLNDALHAKHEAAREAKRQEEAKKKAEQAKSVSSLNVKSAAQARPAAQSWDDDLNAIAAKAYGLR